VGLLRKIRAWEDVKKVKNSKRMRAGKGKMRNRRHVMRRGPLIVYAQDKGIVRAFRNIPGVTLLQVRNLNLLKMAPGGHVGRFTIWTESAFAKLNAIYGTWEKNSKFKKYYNLPMPIMTNTDVSRILSSAEVQKAVCPKKHPTSKAVIKPNPLKNLRAMKRLNPYITVVKRNSYLKRRKAVNDKLKHMAKLRGLDALKKSLKEKKAYRMLKKLSKINFDADKKFSKERSKKLKEAKPLKKKKREEKKKKIAATKKPAKTADKKQPVAKQAKKTKA
jgi:large subunit ribosomal protein L4e